MQVLMTLWVANRKVYGDNKVWKGPPPAMTSGDDGACRTAPLHSSKRGGHRGCGASEPVLLANRSACVRLDLVVLALTDVRHLKNGSQLGAPTVIKDVEPPWTESSVVRRAGRQVEDECELLIVGRRCTQPVVRDTRSDDIAALARGGSSGLG